MNYKFYELSTYGCAKLQKWKHIVKVGIRADIMGLIDTGGLFDTFIYGNHLLMLLSHCHFLLCSLNTYGSQNACCSDVKKTKCIRETSKCIGEGIKRSFNLDDLSIFMRSNYMSLNVSHS